MLSGVEDNDSGLRWRCRLLFAYSSRDMLIPGVLGMCFLALGVGSGAVEASLDPLLGSCVACFLFYCSLQANDKSKLLVWGFNCLFGLTHLLFLVDLLESFGKYLIWVGGTVYPSLSSVPPLQCSWISVMSLVCL